ncbi:mRNA turnover protein 4 homolog [Papaver somniferum]|uniref:mRNA turnover protein 4 homolog n=1 Tax=Papaver somniferum TaxID=3469 RepID=UPI000E703852|nr:mRNA turnover protein 4 homolog [Papaver somniferum]
MESLANDHDNYKVYFAPNKSLAYSVGLVKELTPEEQNLKPGDSGYKTKEFDTGLHEIGSMLDNDNYGVLLTNKTEDEVLSKFGEYREYDFINAGSTPMETLVFEKDEPLPPLTSAKKLCPKLKKLGMPVEPSGKDLKLTERFVVCEVKKRVTENAAKILILLERKMFNFVLLPVCYWSRTTKETKSLVVVLLQRCYPQTSSY